MSTWPHVYFTDLIIDPKEHGEQLGTERRMGDAVPDDETYVWSVAGKP